jgi:N-acetylneuraminic acid mutarotase
MRIDQKKPNFSGKYDFSKESVGEILDKGAIPSPEELIPDRTKSVQKEERVQYLSEDMNEFFYAKDNELWVKELSKTNKVSDSKIMSLKLHLQKVITVPDETENQVFLLGGSKDLSGKEAVDHCYKVDLDGQKLTPIQKMSSPRVSMAAGISPDCKYVVVAGGSRGENIPTNACEILDTETHKWQKLPDLNCPRLSASLIVCTGRNVYCFGGIETEPDDPSNFLTLKSIEWLDYSDSSNEWETLKINVPFKASSSGAI